MDSKEQGIEDAKNDGYSIYMDSQYCENFLKTHKNCDNCEYSFACTKVLEMILKRSVNIVREFLIEEDEVIKDINTEECKQYRLINNSCNKCSNNDKCYIIALKKFAEIKNIEL